MKRGMILGVVFYLLLLFVCFGFFFFFFVVAVVFVRQGYLFLTYVRLLRLYYASDTLFLVTFFHLGVSSFFPVYFAAFTVESFSVVFLFFFFFCSTSLCSRSNAHSIQGVINYFAFLSMNIYSQKRTIHNFSMHFFSFFPTIRLLLGGQFLPCCYSLLTEGISLKGWVVMVHLLYRFERLLGSAVLRRGSLPATRCQ